MVGDKINGVRYRAFRVREADLPEEVKVWDKKIEQYRSRLKEFMRKYDIAYCFFTPYGQVKKVAISEPVLRKWCQYVKPHPIEVHGKTVYIVEPNAKLKAGQTFIAELAELNSFSVTNRHKQKAVLDYYKLEYSMWWKKMRIETEVHKIRDCWYVKSPSTITTGGAVGWGIPDDYTAKDGLEEITLDEYLSSVSAAGRGQAQ